MTAPAERPSIPTAASSSTIPTLTAISLQDRTPTSSRLQVIIRHPINRRSRDIYRPGTPTTPTSDTTLYLTCDTITSFYILDSAQ